MIKTGEKLICWDSTKQDMYTVTAAQDTDNEMEVNPLVKICGVILYPMQARASPVMPYTTECGKGGKAWCRTGTITRRCWQTATC